MIKNLILKTCSIILCAFAVLLDSQNSSAQKYQTLGTAGCGLGQDKCHTSENTRWYRNDPHKLTVEALYDDLENAEKYAEQAGVGAKDLFKGNTSCMQCHATVASGREAKEADEGVSCESCHGPGSGYKDRHTEKPDGYKIALTLGMEDNKNLDVRAKTCVRCHYITDQKILRAGHPTGEKFNYISGIKKVAGHWKRAPGQNELNKALFDKAKAAKGPIGKIVQLNDDKPPPTPPRDDIVPTGSKQKENGESALRAFKRRIVDPPTPPADPVPSPEPIGPIYLEKFPAVSDSMSVQEIILILKKRLEYLYQKTGDR